MNALFSIKPDAVAIIDASDKSEILDALSGVFARSWDLDAENVREYLEERENMGSTGFGRRVAIPHARFPGITRPVTAVLKLAHPVEFGAADGMPVELVFGLLSPENSGASHLRALAAISRLVRDSEVHGALVTAPHEEALYSLLTNATDRDVA